MILQILPSLGPQEPMEKWRFIFTPQYIYIYMGFFTPKNEETLGSHGWPKLSLAIFFRLTFKLKADIASRNGSGGGLLHWHFAPWRSDEAERSTRGWIYLELGINGFKLAMNILEEWDIYIGVITHLRLVSPPSSTLPYQPNPIPVVLRTPTFYREKSWKVPWRW